MNSEATAQVSCQPDTAAETLAEQYERLNKAISQMNEAVILSRHWQDVEAGAGCPADRDYLAARQAIDAHA